MSLSVPLDRNFSSFFNSSKQKGTETTTQKKETPYPSAEPLAKRSCARGMVLSRLVTLTLDARRTDVLTASYLMPRTAPSVWYPRPPPPPAPSLSRRVGWGRMDLTRLKPRLLLLLVVDSFLGSTGTWPRAISGARMQNMMDGRPPRVVAFFVIFWFDAPPLLFFFFFLFLAASGHVPVPGA